MGWGHCVELGSWGVWLGCNFVRGGGCGADLEEGGEWVGFMEVVALVGVALEVLEYLELGEAFYAFGGDGHMEVVGEVDDIFAGRGVWVVGGIEEVDEGFVEFKDFEGELVEVGEGGVAFTEVVEGEGDAHVSEFGEFLEGLLFVGDEEVFGDFELEVCGVEVSEGEDILDGGDDIVLYELFGGHVDGEFEGGG